MIRAEAAHVLESAPDARPERIVLVGGTASNLLKVGAAAPTDDVLTRERLARALALLLLEPAMAVAEQHTIRVRARGSWARARPSSRRSSTGTGSMRPSRPTRGSPGRRSRPPARARPGATPSRTWWAWADLARPARGPPPGARPGQREADPASGAACRAGPGRGLIAAHHPGDLRRILHRPRVRGARTSVSGRIAGIGCRLMRGDQARLPQSPG